MHYALGSGIIVKSENAALTTKQTNKVVLKYISELSSNLVALDYGCGKLRHSIPLYEKAKNLSVIDSDIQINRLQRINGIRTSVISYVQLYMPKAKAFAINSFLWPAQAYDFILCTNVLSAIPDYSERQKILNNIKKMLKPGGKALISVQYSNSYFKTYQNNPAATCFLDGWLIKRKDKTYSFYGIISKDELINMCVSSNLSILNKYQSDGSIYIEVSAKTRL
jgi:2-polyprenyl-3-methyl-5-hydroxy-6-metoxy-1,4-benzoquinol methylase